MEALPGEPMPWVSFVRMRIISGWMRVQCVERFKAEIAGRSDETTPPITVIDGDESIAVCRKAGRSSPAWCWCWCSTALTILAAVADRMLNDPASDPATALLSRCCPGRPPVHGLKSPRRSTVVVLLVQEDRPRKSTSLPSNSGDCRLHSSERQYERCSGRKWRPPHRNGSQLQPSDVSDASAGRSGLWRQNKNSRVVLRMHQAATDSRSEGSDRQVFINRTPKPGDTDQAPNLVGVTLTRSAAGAVEVDLDGSALGLVGKNHETADALSLDPHHRGSRQWRTPSKTRLS